MHTDPPAYYWISAHAMNQRHLLRLCLLCAILLPTSAYAYVGPGLGAGMLATIVGIVAGIGMLALGVIWYPLKKLIRWVRSSKSP